MSSSYTDTPKDELLRWLAKRLGYDDLPNALLKRLESRHLISEALQDLDPQSLNPSPPAKTVKEDLLKEARQEIQFAREFQRDLDTSHSDGRKSQTISDRQLEAEGLETPDLLRRANAVVPYLLKQHALNRRVKEIRGSIGAPLPRDAARKLLQPADVATEDYASIWNGEEVVEVDLGRSAVAREALKTAQYLYGPWLPTDVVWWIFSDEPPRISVIQAEIMGWGWSWPAITLRIPVWTPTDDVKEFYTRLRQSESFRHLHDPAPCPSPKRLAVFRFVSEYSEFDERRLWKRIFAPRASWRKLMGLWNAQPGLTSDWVYNDERNFRRAFVNTRDALIRVRD